MGKLQNLKFLFLFFFIFTLSCAKPTVVNITLPGDEELNCKELDFQVIEAQKIKKEAWAAADQTGANVTRMALFWPAWAATLHNADKAISAADDRTFHLYKIMKTKNCKETKKVRTFVTDRRNNFIGLTRELKELKKLHNSGDLTDEEYSRAKKKVLD